MFTFSANNPCKVFTVIWTSLSKVKSKYEFEPINLQTMSSKFKESIRFLFLVWVKDCIIERIWMTIVSFASISFQTFGLSFNAFEMTISFEWVNFSSTLCQMSLSAI